MKTMPLGLVLQILVAATACSGSSRAQEKAGDEQSLAQVRDGYAGRRAAIHSFGVRITYHENRRVLRGGPFRSIVQTIETVFDERGRAKIDMLESAPVEGEPGPAKPAGNRLLATTNIDGTRKLVTGTSLDPNNKVTALLGFISPERGLSWAVHPTELLCIFDYDPFASYIETGKGQVVGKEKLDGRETIRVEWGFDTNSPPGSALKGVYWFAPDLGYAIVSSEVFRSRCCPRRGDHS